MRSAAIEKHMTERERTLLKAEIGDGSVRLMLRTGTRVDTGRWLRSSRLWLCVTDHDIVLLAASRRQYCQQVKLSDVAQSWYSHPTGNLVLEPGEDLQFRHIAMSPTDAVRVLKMIEASNESSKNLHSTSLEN